VTIDSVVDGTSRTAAFAEWVKGPAIDNFGLATRDPKGWVWRFPAADPEGNQLGAGFGDLTKGDLWFNKTCNSATTATWAWKGEYWTLGHGGRGSGISFSVKPNGLSCKGEGGDPNDSGMAASSRHPGGVNIAMLDGSTQFVSESIDFAVWWAYGSRAGAETF